MERTDQHEVLLPDRDSNMRRHVELTAFDWTDFWFEHRFATRYLYFFWTFGCQTKEFTFTQSVNWTF